MTSADEIYTVERLGIINIDDLAQLYKAVYGREQLAGFYRKKYDTTYTGAKYIGFIAYNPQHRPIAYYGVIPTLLWYNGRTILSAQSADTMTHPEYRNMGLFIELANQTYELCRKEHIRLIFGFPNQNSFPGLINKLNWQLTETMDRFLIPVKGVLPLEKIAHKYPVLKPMYDRYKKWVLKDHLKLQRGVANSVLADNYNGVFRDDKYFKYKTYSSTLVIKISHSLFWIKLQNGLQIGDIAGLADDFDNAMQKLCALARKLGVTEIHFHTSQQTQLHALFAQRYQSHASYPIVFKDLGEGIITEKIKFTFADIDVF